MATRVQRAQLLDRLGRSDEAANAYADVLAREPDHFGALNDLALLLYRTGRRGDALMLFADAVQRHPGNAVAHANFGFVLLKGGDLERARASYESAVRLDPGNVEAQRGLATVRAQLGEVVAAAGAGTSLVTVPFTGNGTPVSVLLLVTLGAGNVAAERFLDPRVFATTKLTVELHEGALPAHEVVFNAIGDADSAGPALARASALLDGDRAPLINPPADVALTTRAGNADRLSGLPGVRTARTALVPRAELTGPDGAAALERRGFVFPLLLRSPGFHTGQHFEYVAAGRELAVAAGALPGEVLLAIEYVDTREPGGSYAKYRAMLVDGHLFPLHLAIGRQWKVHYFSAEMAERPDYREREQRYLDDMAGTLGPAATNALASVGAALALDYAGIDFGFTPSGELVVFEANATMVVVPPAADERWEYRRAAIARVGDAVRGMLIGRAALPR
ncbi:MAG TPA: tetratricopeptide repeat protein [Candidatus Sulfotelmatobacter sp.]|nr:tetratricopeptide repeat protein [Candidatus Sulfotelmatobacter sp.]